MPTIYWFVVVSGVVALLYGVYASRSVLAADSGTARMQEISTAIQEGARAYLNRQYMAIGMVGLVVFGALWALLGIYVAFGFLIRPLLPGAAGYLAGPPRFTAAVGSIFQPPGETEGGARVLVAAGSEGLRVGKGGRSRGSPHH